MNKKKRLLILNKLNIANIKNKTNINFISNFEFLIATILSSKSKDEMVNKVLTSLRKYAKSPSEMVNLNENKIKGIIKCLGMYNLKTKYIMKTCNILINKYNSVVPNKRNELEELPGIGRKSSNIILNVLFNHHTIAVDTHVFRVANRTGIAIGKSTLEVEKKLLQYTPDTLIKNLHNCLFTHGRYICKSKQPICNKCIIYDLCENNKL